MKTTMLKMILAADLDIKMSVAPVLKVRLV